MSYELKIDRYLLSTVLSYIRLFLAKDNYCVQINAFPTYFNEGGLLKAL